MSTLTIGATTKSDAFHQDGQVIEVAISYAGTYTTGGDATTLADFIGTGYTGVFLGGEVVKGDETVYLKPKFNIAGTTLMLYDGNAQYAAASLATYVGKLRFARW